MLDATVGGVASNSYLTLARANAILAEHLGTEAWDALTDVDDAQQEAALIQATRGLDTQIVWLGTPATTTQALACPQCGLVDRWGRPIPSTVIPVEVEQATAYYALGLLQAAAAGQTGSSGQIKRTKLGSTEVEYFQDTLTTTVRGAGIASEIKSLLRPYGDIPGLLTVPLVRR